LVAQCSGTLTLSTQAEVDAFDCAVFDGDLIISGADIVNLDPLFSVPGATLTEVTGSLTVDNCPNLTSLQGLDGITTVGADYNIYDNPMLNTLGCCGHQLVTAGNLNFKNCPLLTDVTFNSLTTVEGFLDFKNGMAINDFSGFNNLTTAGAIQISNNTTTTINGFEGLISTSYINILENPMLMEITGFNNLTAIVEGAVNGQTINYFQIAENPMLSSITGFTVLTTADAGVISGNTSLSDCCFSLPFVENLTISNNAPGCNSQAEINAPPVFTNCPADDFMFLDSDACFATVEILFPTVDDNCDLATYELLIERPDGSTQTLPLFFDSESITDILPIGENTYTWTATDDKGNVSTCTLVMSVFNVDFEVNGDFPSNLTLDNIPGICEATYEYIFPEITHICGLDTLSFHVYDESLETMLYVNNPTAQELVSIDLAPGIYVAEVFYGNLGSAFVGNAVITINDNEAPILSACPDDLTISTSESFCLGVADIVSPTISDNCEIESYVLNYVSGDGTIVNDLEISSGELLSFGFSPDQNTVTYVATDVHGNSSSCTVTVTVVDDDAPTIPAAQLLDVTVNTNPGVCTGTYTFLASAATDNCGTIETQIVYAGNQVEILGPGDDYTYDFAPGIYQLDYEVVDDAGNIGFYTQNFTVVDNQIPVFTEELPTDVTISTNPGTCEGTHSVTFPAGTDNCGITYREFYVTDEGGNNIINEFPSDAGEVITFDLPPGVYDVEAFIIDAGFLGDISQTSLTIVDNEAPVISCIPDFTVNQDANNFCLASWTMTDPTPTDNCGYEAGTFERISPSGIVSSGSLVPGLDWNQNQNELGDWIFTYTATDENGNEASCSTTVTVEAGPTAMSGFSYTRTGLQIDMTNTSTNAASYAWDFEDGTTSTEQNPSHVYTEEGSYMVCLTVTSCDGTEETFCEMIEVTVDAELLTAFLIDGSATFSQGQTREALFLLQNAGTSPTVGTIQFVITLPGLATFGHSMDPNLTSSSIFGGIDLANTDFDFVSLGGGGNNYLLSSKPGVSLGAGEFIYLGFDLTAVGNSTSTAQATGTIGTGSAGDEISANNKSQGTFSIN